LFIGANQDAALTAEQMGMDRDKSLDMAHDGDGAEAAQQSVSASVSRAREQGTTGGFSQEDRQRQDRSEDGVVDNTTTPDGSGWWEASNGTGCRQRIAFSPASRVSERAPAAYRAQIAKSWG
jgi:hypothetical protein